MTATAVAFMILAMVVIWGGLVLSVVRLRRDATGGADAGHSHPDYDTPHVDSPHVDSPHGHDTALGRVDTAYREGDTPDGENAR